MVATAGSACTSKAPSGEVTSSSEPSKDLASTSAPTGSLASTTEGEPTPNASTDNPPSENTVSSPESGATAGLPSVSDAVDETLASNVPPSSTDNSASGNSDEQNTSGDVDTAEGPSTSSTRFRSVPVGTTDAMLGFWEYLPPNYDQTPAPLLIFTHGASWQGPGTEESLQELLEVGPPNLIGEGRWPDSRPFIVLSPQNPRSGCFDANDIRDFYTYALATYNVDETRLYHTGQSCGAIGAWNYLAANSNEHVVAAVLISGDGRDAFSQAGCELGKVAIWGLHNENDGSVPAAGTVEPLEALQNCSPTPDVKLTIYPGETAHDAWTKTYDLSAGNDVYSWLLQHQRQ